MITILFLLRLAQALPHFTDSYSDFKIQLGGLGGSLLSYVINLGKIAITAVGVLTGHRKLYRKARSLLNCTDTKSELKLVS